MRLEFNLNMRQEMRLKLAPQIIQSIEILQLPLLDLRNRIDQELLENPLLEIALDGPDEHDESPAEETESPVDLELVEAPREEPETETEPIQTEDYDALGEMIPQYEDVGDLTRRTRATG